ncbi:MAG: TatD family hydrolase [Clostridium sp.]|nr:TatD family hydrolase [Clostridium sp.]
MRLFDSHAHYDDEKFDQDREEIIQKIYDSGVEKFISAGYSLESSKRAIELADKYEFIYTTVGISPNDVKQTLEETIEDIKKLEDIITRKENDKIVGIGEIGLDYYWNKENKEIQKQAFIMQIELANRLNLPITIHTREAVSDTLEILKQHPVQQKGVFHCCPLNRELVKEALKLGFYISFAGPVTFKNSKNAQEIVEMVPNDRMLIETDSPYLAPEPVRGTRNDSRNVKYIAEKIANIKNLLTEEIAEITYQNTLKIFKI